MEIKRKWLFIVPLAAALIMGACSADNALSPADALLKRDPPPPVVNGPVWVLGDITIEDAVLGGGSPGVNSHPQDKGTCRKADGTVGDSEDNLFWFNSQGQLTGAKFCLGEPAGTETLECTIDEDGLPATYAFGTGGQGAPGPSQTSNNENLNFHSDLLTWDPDGPQFVHFQAAENKNKNASTIGKDWTAFKMTCDIDGDDIPFDGFIDLSAFSGAGNAFFGGGTCQGDRCLDTGTGVPVLLFAEGENPVDNEGGELFEGLLESMYWEFRSRIPN